MKSLITFLTITSTFGLSSHAQVIESWITQPNPPVIGQHLDLMVGLNFMYIGANSQGKPFKCEELLGYIYQNKNGQQTLDIYYTLSEVGFYIQCSHADTFSLGILDSKIEKIAVNTFVVTLDSLNQPDTSAIYDSDTVYLAQIGLPQYGKANGFEVYPIPAKDKITIKAPHQGLLENLVLLDLSGRKVLSLEHFDPQQTLYLPNLPAGIYFLQFEQGEALFREKVLVE